jgi:hypothetical protein
MKNVCKKWMWIYCFLIFLGASLLTACSEIVDADSDFVLPPDSSRLIVHKLYPNDMAKNDSVAANLARGVMLVVHPKASYKLSFDVDTTQPVPELQLFRTFPIKGETDRVGFTKVRTLTPQIIDNRYVYSFTCAENKMSIWFTSLGVDGKYYEGEVNNIHMEGIGAYSDHMSIDLIVVGSMEKTDDGKNIEQLSRDMLDMFRKKYYGVTVDTIYVRYAHDHPTLGDKYPQNKPWVAGVNSDDYFVSELAGWPEEGLSNALNIVLVHSIGENDIMGFSRLFSGVMGAGKEGSVVIGEHVRKSSGELELLSSKSIVMTAIHETGHFFGLRHTSTTRRDMNQMVTLDDGSSAMVGDNSNVEDGLADTPFCRYVLESGLYKQAEEHEFVRGDIYYMNRPNHLAKSSLYSCPDLDNIMFPVTVDDGQEVSFTKQQMELIRSSLMIFTH